VLRQSPQAQTEEERVLSDIAAYCEIVSRGGNKASTHVAEEILKHIAMYMPSIDKTNT